MPDRPDSAHGQTRDFGDDDTGWVARCRRGDVDAFAVLVRRHQKRMLNIAYRMTGDYEDACDAVQEAFLSAWRAIGKFRGEARFSTWLTGIVLNQSRNRLAARRADRARGEGTSFADPPQGGDGRPRNNCCSLEDSALERLEKREREAEVQRCIGALVEEQREVLILRDIQGFSYGEIGDMLNLPEGTVKSRLFRARIALKEGLLSALGDLQ